MNILAYTDIEDYKNLKKNKNYTGHEIFSHIIPKRINADMLGVKIKNGQLLEGKINKDFLGAKKKSSIHQLIWDEYGADETQKFLDNAQRLMNNYNLQSGFTVGIGDIEVSDKLAGQMRDIFSTKDLKVSHKITEVENNPELMTEELLESLYLVKST